MKKQLVAISVFLMLLVSIFSVALPTIRVSASPSSTLHVVQYGFRTRYTGTAQWTTADAHSGSLSFNLSTGSSSSGAAIIALRCNLVSSTFPFEGTLSDLYYAVLTYWAKNVTWTTVNFYPWVQIYLDMDDDGVFDWGPSESDWILQGEPYYWLQYNTAPEENGWKQFNASTLYFFDGNYTYSYVTSAHQKRTLDWYLANTPLGDEDILRLYIMVGYGASWVNTIGLVDDIALGGIIYHGSIQDAVDAASPGDTIIVHDGTYDEQVVIDKSLTLQGGSTPIVKPSSAATLTKVFDGLFWYGTPNTKKIAGIIVANVPDGSNVIIKDLKVDESSVTTKPAGADYLAGIFYRETGGTIDTVEIVGTGAWSGGDRAYGIYLSAATNSVSVEITGSTITNFDKNGIEAHGNKLTFNIHHNTITGRGSVSDEVQNGVNVGRDAAGTVNYNTISNLEYGPKTWWAAAIMFYHYVSPAGVSGSAQGNTITNCQIGIIFKNGNGWAQDNTVAGGTVGLIGIYAEPNIAGAYTASFVNNTVSGVRDTGTYENAAIGANTYATGVSLTATVRNNTLSGGGSTNADGVYIGGSAGSVTATISDNIISGWNYGINLASARVAGAAITGNNITGTYLGIRMENATGVQICDNRIIDFVKGGIVTRGAKNILVEGNIISTTLHDVAPNGIDIGIYTGTNGTVKGNNISGCSWNGFTGDYETSWSGSGILVIESGDSLEVIGNIVHDCDIGMDIESDLMNMTCNEVYNNIYGFVFWNAKPKVNYNNIYNNIQYGVYRTAMGNLTGVLDARFNWWGDASGPTHPSNLGGTGDKISDNVDYSPWLGFVVGTTPMTWHVNPTGAPGAIQEAINEASPGDTIIVHEGTYYENLVVQKALTIQGVDKETTIIQAQPVGYGDKAVEIQTSDVTISGFTISGYAATETKPGSTYWGVYAYGSSSSHYSNIVVTDCIFTFLSQSGIQLGYVDGSLIADNIFKRETRLVWYDPPGPTPGSYIEVTRGGAGPALWYCTDVTIDPNVVQTTGVGIFLYSSSDILIEANTISAPDTVNPSDIGIHVQSCTDIDIIGNTVLNFTAGPKSGYTYGTTGAGINILASKAINVSLNNLRNNTVGVLVQRLNLTTEPREIDIHSNNLEHNTAFGVLNCYTWVGKDKTYTPTNASYIVDARYNWWGHETGPYHATSWTYMGMPYGPNYGLGNNVSDYVLYYLWLPVVHDVAVIDVVPSPTTVVAGETVTIDVTAKNEGNDYESFTVTVYYDDTPIASQNVVNLPPKWSTTLTFHWDTTGMPRGNYTIKANATIVPEETDIEDNTLIDGVVEVLWHDVAVTGVVPSRNWVYQGYMVNINVTVLNEGDFPETVTVTLYYNITANKVIGTQIINLLPGESQTLVFTWDTTGVEYCHNYTLTALATIIPPDNDPTDNTFTDGKVKVRIVGDANGDGIVDISDIYAVALGFGETPSRPRWNPDLDINNDEIIDIEDIYTVAINYGKSI